MHDRPAVHTTDGRVIYFDSNNERAEYINKMGSGKKQPKKTPSPGKKVSKGAWGKRYEHDYGQDDMHNYKAGRYLAGAGAATYAGSAGYAGAQGAKMVKDPATAERVKHAMHDPEHLKRVISESPYAAKMKHASTGMKVGGGLMLAAPVVGVGNMARKRINRMRNQKSNF